MQAAALALDPQTLALAASGKYAARPQGRGAEGGGVGGGNAHFLGSWT